MTHVSNKNIVRCQVLIAAAIVLIVGFSQVYAHNYNKGVQARGQMLVELLRAENKFSAYDYNN